MGQAPDVVDLSKLQIKRSEDFGNLYANTLRVNISFQDASIVFGEIIEAEPGKFEVEDLMDVKMPLSQAKILANVLTESVLAYELEFGQQLPVPKQYSPHEYREIIKPIIKKMKEAIS
jgi:hypothetical protein